MNENELAKEILKCNLSEDAKIEILKVLFNNSKNNNVYNQPNTITSPWICYYKTDKSTNNTEITS